MATYTCDTCGTQYQSFPSWQHAKDGRHYCSPDCGHHARRTRTDHECQRCGKPYSATPSQLQYRRYRFCSEECAQHDRLWSMVEQRPDGCWRWRGSQGNGYPRINMGHGPQYVHHLLWDLAHGSGEHRGNLARMCDQPGCVNPAHWSNTAPARRPRKPGGWSGLRKLTPEQVRWVWAMHHAGRTVPEIMRAVPASSAALYSLLSGRTYRDAMPVALEQAA